MKNQRFSLFAFLPLFLFLLCGSLSFAQPGGGHGGFGEHGGGHGDRPMGPGSNRRPSLSDREQFRKRMQNDRTAQQSQSIRQKKNVKEGSTFKVIGTLRDTVSGELIPFVNVAVLDSVDSSFVKGGSTNLDGYFEISGIPAGGYLLRVSAIGYRNTIIPFHVSNNTALGSLWIKPGATQLKEVEITAERPLYAMDGEKMIYNVSDDPSIQSGTTSDALQNAPGVEVDVEGNVSLRGTSSVEIWVNDKPSRLTEENLKTYLETLPANALARIETITNPSAKYATSAESVINIITSAYIKSNHFISFGVNGNTQPSVSPWISYTWANERLTINLGGNLRYNYSSSEGWDSTTYRKNHNASFDGSFDTTAIEANTKENWSKRLSGGAYASIDYRIDSMTDVSFRIHGNYSGNWSENILDRDRNDFVSSLQSHFSSNSNNNNHSAFGMVSADLTHKFDNNGHNIRLSIHNAYNHGDEIQDLVRLFTNSSDPNVDKRYYNVSTTNNLDISARYNLPYSEQGEFSFGLGYGQSNTWKNYNVMDSSIHTDLLRSYSFTDLENSIEGDFEWTRRWGNFTLELGLGANFEHIDFSYVGSPLYDFTNDQLQRNFVTYNPSLHLSYRTQDMHNFKLNYSMRMNRPDESTISTYKRYSLDGWSSGRREITFSYTHSAEAGWSKFFERFGYLGIDGYARYSANEVSNLTTGTDEDDPILNRIVQFTQPYNMGSSYRIGGTFFVTYRPSGFINIRLNTNIYDYGYHLDRGNKGVLDNNKVSWSTRLNCWFKVFNRYQIWLTGRYNSGTISLAAERSARYGIDLGVKADFFKRKLSAFISVQDIFNWGKTVGNGAKNTDPYLLSVSNSYTLNSRFISAGITLRFGKMELERQQESMDNSGSEE